MSSFFAECIYRQCFMQSMVDGFMKLWQFIIHYNDNKGLLMPRVELNAKAPDFTLNDFNGKTISLADFTGQKNVLVVFNRGFF